ncbi:MULTISPECIES: ShlB/FhaC/HecB family hemolysin secretion/activation protein [Ramlibacter]|uniref:ShlB/FhaC/HecB family hemolysin secretion/activation protein n=1 Tax=Ramlibacter aquaticus TaxID=2780094 RepID=A0ABR9SEC0_9BURK|nr:MULTISPECIES: ShlB/FhaC/HecB family hemolysin secretion/activation protein [Ramlibacter]MBE7940625.1 ShlB/FhaC/HecB family hemolysin secretion/activation protein [Ramlibacter aquaticus]
MVECRPTWVLIGVLSGAVHAQGVDALSDQARRERERQEQFRELLQPSPSIQLQRNPTPRVGRLPEELPCVRVNAIVIEGQEPLAVREDELPLWLAGPGEDPIGRCIGARGIDLLGTRLQNGLIGRGYVTSRVLVPTQQVAQGVLTFTVLPGRIAGIRGDFPRAGAIPPLRPGDVLNLRDIEQALEALQRVPTARADIQIEPASDASLGPG